MNNNPKTCLDALSHIPCSECSYQEWVNVGMALQGEGFDYSVWDAWSRTDPDRYKPGECERKWKTFHGAGTPVTGGTIVQMAKQRGYDPRSSLVMGWDDEIFDDGDDFNEHFAPDEFNPCEQLKTYLLTLFKPDELVSFVTNDVWQDKDRWVPGKGVSDRTAGELIASLEKHPDDLGATVGDWKPDAGAWIRFNPVDGKGVKNDNVAAFRYALVESDSMPISDQDAMIRKLELPVACLVHSGGKSLHAIVRVDVKDHQEYRKRVEFLYDFLEKNGMAVDKQNRNPSHLSRMPGATRNGNHQYLVATNIGRRNWTDWLDYVEGVTDEMPKLVSLSEYKDHPPVLPEELIQGILRRGHKMLISGSSKAGKSFLLMELCIAIAEGIPWLGFPCKKGRVLYVNLEIDPASAINRFLNIYSALGLPIRHADDIIIWNLRGHAVPLDQLVPKLIRRVRDQHLDAIIIDPIYKVITGDENSASDMGAFCNQFDKICTETGCSTIYCHHHSKGAQGAKRAIDRASGSGVFARDPDAQLDMIQLELDDVTRNSLAYDGMTAWRLEGTLREFKSFKPVEFWFQYPIHKLASGDILEELPPIGSAEAGRLQNGKSKTAKQCADEFRFAFECENMDGNGVSVKDMATHLGLAERTVRERVKKMDGEFILEGGIIRRA